MSSAQGALPGFDGLMDGYLSVHYPLILLPEHRYSMSKQRLCRPCCCTGELIRYTRLRNYCALTERSLRLTLWFLLTEEFQNSRLAFSSPRLYETSPFFLYGTQPCLSQFIFWPHLPLTQISFSGRGFTLQEVWLSCVENSLHLGWRRSSWKM